MIILYLHDCLDPHHHVPCSDDEEDLRQLLLHISDKSDRDDVCLGNVVEVYTPTRKTKHK